ncbi:Bacterial type II secretion system protein F domain protein [Microbacterium ginsengisoli]|uniref:Bacterial type II secretion system protein F domain protein n=1 Tax=Microbacterium ginsengisoli TaxID=400772 RepID=A0A0F0M097_9MICO|nr:type II secretion system F family protein [Microbacterium ginsengisoli]KJL40059.1 Bacterial type II secretion system protein F domain protein [Microbacterium ginsengisoli]
MIGAVRNGSRRRAPDPMSPPADVALQLAVLLQAGVTPDRAWEHIVAAGARDLAPLTDGGDRAVALARLGDQWAPLAAVWQVAMTVGAPLAVTLRDAATAVRDADEVRDEIAVALAEPVATARLVAWLPAVAVLLSLALGFDLSAVVRSPIGIACLLAGVALMLLARRWTRRLVARAQPAAGVAGIDADLVAIALSGGTSLDAARRAAAEAGHPVTVETVRALELSMRAGVPAAELLRAQAARQRRLARTDGRERAARLGSALLLPLGVCTLPAFLLLGVAPMILGVLASGGGVI